MMRVFKERLQGKLGVRRRQKQPLVQSETQFSHTPLPGERYIRVLRILPGDTELLSITLHTFSLQNLPSYDALSYTWGKATQAEGQEDDNIDLGTIHPISVDGKQYHITENLYDGLLELRKSLTGYLWVDALCIDQENIDERASQVLLMGDVYSKARKVIVWLGKEMAMVVDVIWLMDHCLPIALEGRFPEEEVNMELLNLLGLNVDRWFDLWEAHGRFYSSYRWFTRAWVVQELVLARDIVLRCGGKVIDWDDLLRLIELALKSGIPLFDECKRFFTLAALQSLVADGKPIDLLTQLLSIVTGTSTPEGRWYTWVLHLVDMIRSQSASRPHDKLYAVFGLAQMSLPPGLVLSDSLVVKYEQPVEDLFVSFASHLIRHMPKLAVLSHVVVHSTTAPSRLPNLPSWCPDFTAVRLGRPLVAANMHLSDQVHAFAASGSLTRFYEAPRISGSVLSIAARSVAKVAEPGQAIQPIFDIKANFDPPNSEGFFEACLCLEPVYSLTGQDRVEVLWRTLLADCDFIHATENGGPPTSEKFAPAFAAFVAFQSSLLLGLLEGSEKEDFINVVREREERFRSSTVELPTLSKIVELGEKQGRNPEFLMFSDLLEPSNYFRYRAGQYSHGRRLFTTSQKWLGFGPESLQKDDEVWLLSGADVPFILRPRGENQYTLIGEAYVHGIMHGELVNVPGGSDGFHVIDIV